MNRTRHLTLGLLIILFVGGVYYLGFRVGQEQPKTILVQGLANITEGKPDAIDFGVFWQAWDIVSTDYLRHKDVSNDDKVYGAMRGLVQSLNDPYSEFFNPVDNTRFQEDIRGDFGGIGAELGIRNGRLVVIAPLKNTPASRAGLLPGDVIAKINTTSTQNLQIDEAISYIRGPVNTPVTLSVFREGWDDLRDFKLIRDQIIIPTLESEVKEGNILYVQLHGFNANSGQLLAQAFQKSFSNPGVAGLVLDLRNNPGGYLEVAVDMAGWFVERDKLIVAERGLTENQEFLSRGNAVLKDLPIVILINKGSASASEILAGALQDHKKAVLVGEQSFGKGTVQELKTLRDGSSIKLTIAHWVLPNGTVIEGNGLTPDYKVEITDKDREAERDPQLEKALELVRAKAKTIFKAP